MRPLLLSTALATALALSGQSAFAEDIALVIGTDRYERLGNISRGADVTVATTGISALGFDVAVLRNGRADQAAEALADFAEKVAEADRIIVALSGRFVTDGGRTWLLPADAAAPGLLTVDGISVETVLRLLSTAPGQAVLVLGVDPGADDALDGWLREGVGDLDIPQGVTVLTGEPRHAAAFLEAALAEPEGDLAAAIAADGRITADGFVPRAFTFMPGVPAIVAPDVPVTDDAAADEALWRRVVAQDNVEAYRGYLRQFPNGRHTDEAEAAIAAILAEPFRDERLAEEALALTRDQRRDIQSDLTMMGFNTRGIDGIFGQGTRRAITNWQQENGFAQTGFMTMEQINRLDAQAARREAEQAAETERQRQEAERLDRAYWDETGSRGDEAGLRAYLNRYPQGLYADVATDRLAAIEESARQEAATRDRTAWNAARDANEVGAYRQYLRDFPQGAFAAEAQARIDAFEGTTAPEPEPEAEPGASDQDTARAQAVENALNLNGLTARLVESRLAALGLDPGSVDGTFDDRTRRAIRQFQDGNGIAATGYLDEQTMVLLLAGVFGD